MREINKIIAFYETLKTDAKNACALATVVYVEGSSYRRTGARMLVSEDGRWEGGISGGCLEGDALKKARLSILKGKPNLAKYDTTKGDDHQIGVGLGCNGIIEVLFLPINFELDNNPIEILKSAILEPEIPLITVFKSEKNTAFLGKIFQYKTPNDINFLEEICDIQTLEQEFKSLDKSKNLQIDNHSRLFFEILPSNVDVFLFGHQYDIYPFIEILKWLHWNITVVTEPNKIENKTGINIISPENFDISIFTKNSAAILMSHSLQTDKKNLALLAKSKLKYIGLLGPKVRSEKMLAELKESGIEVNPTQIFGPTGLDIGATTPEEIALAIVAEIKAVFSDRKGGYLKERTLPINERTQEIFNFN
ncbi:XdhC family protein [Lacihabitans sp. CCS-44]|uniref:XdhC family protein n=1 Tax=Lacihabitans sp. CCS-44 TaxID=2487331 RepID=UPI0020CCC0D2|nr:XdhC family protein [Lacihabitans sp. CCS-44]MCP9756731.1 XdhC family protein [Lacihabitans sp. CCS-44]